METPKIALVLTVKNEARLLRHNLEYHHAIGVGHIFVYLDGTTDQGKETIADLPFVSIQESVSHERYASVPYLEKFTSQAKEHHTARQCLNTYHASQEAEAMGYDWLISIDADELVCPSIKEPISLEVFFQKLSPEVAVVNFKTLEALQQRSQYAHVFSEETHFKSTKTFKRRIDRIHKKIQNPFSGELQKFSWWYGHTLGKAAIRLHQQIIPHNVHRYVYQNGEAPQRMDQGFILHYHAYDAADFRKKFTNFKHHPDTFLSGNKVKDFKLLLRDVVNVSGMSEAQLDAYFEQYLKFSETEVKRLLKNRNRLGFKRAQPALLTITYPQQVFKKLNHG